MGKKGFLQGGMRTIFLPVLCLFGLTGCWDRIEVNDLGIVIAAAMDTAPGNRIRFSEQVSIPGRMGGGVGGGGSAGTSQDPPYFTFSGVGLDLKDAMQNLQVQLSRRLFLAHRRILLISEDIARQGIKQHLDELSRNPQSRLRTNVVITKGKSVDYLKIRYPFERVSTEGLRKIFFGEVLNYQLDIKDLMIMLSTPGSGAMLPIVKLAPTSPGAPPNYEADGLAVLKNGRMIGELNNRETRGVLWLREQMRRSIVTVTIPGHRGTISCQLLRVNGQFQVQMAGGHPVMKIRIRPEDDVVENNTDLDLNDPQNVKKVEQAYSASVKKNMETALDTLQHRYKTDILGFGERVHREYPAEWEQLIARWDDEFSRMPVKIEVDGKTRRVGMTGPSLTREENEVKRS